MATHEQDTATPTPAPAPPAPMIDAPTPAAPVPLPVGGLVVGHAEDRAEAEADQMADSALSRLARLTGETHQHGPGCDHLRRSAAPAGGGGAVVGHEGGALDTDTSSTIERMRGAGRGLEEPVRRRMESAFGTSFSGVRIHDGSTAAGLNSAVSARAFTTGSDIFFGRGEYAPDTRSGERVLAHELAHTLQPESAMGRLVRTASVIRRTGGKDEPASAPPSAPGPQHPSPARTEPLASTPVEELAPGEAGPEALPNDVVEMAPGEAGPISYLAMFMEIDDKAALKTAEERGVLAGKRTKLLMEGFEGDWFKAKDCLVFGQWPGSAKPTFSSDTSLALMKGLLKLRDEIHTAVQAETHGAIKGTLGAGATNLENNEFVKGGGAAKEKLGAALKAQGEDPALAAKQHVEYKDAAGAESVTSDLDISTGGVNTEIAVKVYNEQFRKLMRTSLDPGTVLDLNVYAMDFIHGPDWNADKTVLKAKTEHSLALESSSARLSGDAKVAQDAADKVNQAKADAEQDIYALTHIARFLTGDEWTAYADSVVAGVTSPDEQRNQRRLLLQARDRADAFEATILETIAKLVKADKALEQVGVASSWSEADGGAHYAENAKRMRAANHVYEQKLLQVKALRQQIAELDAAKSSEPTDIAQLRLLISQVAETVSEASLYANEVYGSAGATVHAVVAVQMGRKRQKANIDEARRTKEAGSDQAKLGALKNEKNEAHKPRAKDAVAVTVVMEQEAWKQAFTDNLGDVLKDFQHYGHSVREGQEPNYSYAAFKMGKYADRMVDAAAHLSESFSPEDNERLQAMPELKELRDLALQHVKAKAGKGGDDPKSLAEEGYFEGMSKADIFMIKKHAIKLGTTVRAMWVNKASAPPVGGASSAPPSAPPPSAPVPEAAVPSSADAPGPASVPTPVTDERGQVPALLAALEHAVDADQALPADLAGAR